MQRLSVVRILPKEADHGKKATLGGTFDCHAILQGKEVTGFSITQSETSHFWISDPVP